MNIFHYGQMLLNDDVQDESDWEHLVAQSLDAIKTCNDPKMLTELFEMDLNLQFPIEVRELILERRILLGDFRPDTLGAYWSHLGLFYIHSPLRQWLGDEFKRIEQTGKTLDDYRKLGEELATRLSKIA
jgi:hypothetical protein